jgi:2-oxoglutarate dehydrogenase E1 component
MHIADRGAPLPAGRMEGADKASNSPRRQEGDPAGRVRGEQYEKFLGKKYVGTKRFGLDGGDR